MIIVWHPAALENDGCVRFSVFLAHNFKLLITYQDGEEGTARLDLFPTVSEPDRDFVRATTSDAVDCI